MSKIWKVTRVATYYPKISVIPAYLATRESVESERFDKVPML